MAASGTEEKSRVDKLLELKKWYEDKLSAPSDEARVLKALEDQRDKFLAQLATLDEVKNAKKRETLAKAVASLQKTIKETALPLYEKRKEEIIARVHEELEGEIIAQVPEAAQSPRLLQLLQMIFEDISSLDTKGIKKIDRVIEVLRVTFMIRQSLQEEPPNLKKVHDMLRANDDTVRFAQEAVKAVKEGGARDSCYADMQILIELSKLRHYGEPPTEPPALGGWRKVAAILFGDKRYATARRAYRDQKERYDSNLVSKDVLTQIEILLSNVSLMDQQKNHGHYSTTASLAQSRQDVFFPPASSVSSSSSHDQEEEKKVVIVASPAQSHKGVFFPPASPVPSLSPHDQEGEKKVARVAAMEIENAPLSQKPTSKLLEQVRRRIFGK